MTDCALFATVDEHRAFVTEASRSSPRPVARKT